MTDDAAAFQKAVTVAAAKHGYVSVPAPRVAYRINRSVRVVSGITITGGAAGPTIVGGVPRSFAFRLLNVSDASVSCLRFNFAHLEHASGVQVTGSRDVTLSNLSFENFTQGWAINVGSNDGNSTANSNTNVTVSDSDFSGFDSSLAELILFNSSDLTVSGCHFGSNPYHPSGGGLGLYQNDNGVRVVGNTFGPMIGNTEVFYSITVNDVTFEGNTFIGDGSATTGKGNVAIKGANPSDHGLFGQSKVSNYTISDNTFENLHMALQLGALDGARVSGNRFIGNNLAVEVDGGNPFGRYRLDTPDSGVTIEANQFTNNGSSAGARGLAGSILFKGTAAPQGVSVTGNLIESAASSPIVFVGTQTGSGVSITGNQYDGSGGTLVAHVRGGRALATVGGT